MMHLKRTYLKEKGDTIVEVLIAIAVVSSVLGIAYSIMNRNTLTVRDNQERSEASKIAQGQLELLKNAWDGKISQSSFDSLTSLDAFCLTSSTTNAPVNHPEILDTITGYDSGCVQNVLYHYFITKKTEGGGNTGYTVTVRWDSLNSGTSEIVMAYRLK